MFHETMEEIDIAVLTSAEVVVCVLEYVRQWVGLDGEEGGKRRERSAISM